MNPDKVKISRSAESNLHYEVYSEVILAALQYLDPSLNQEEYWDYENHRYDTGSLIHDLEFYYDFSNEISVQEFNDRYMRALTDDYDNTEFIQRIANGSLYRVMLLVNNYFEECLRTGLPIEDLFTFAMQESLIAVGEMTRDQTQLRNPYMSFQQRLRKEIETRYFYGNKRDRDIEWREEPDLSMSGVKRVSINGIHPIEREVVEALDDFLRTVGKRTREKYRNLFIDHMIYEVPLDELWEPLGFKNRRSAESTCSKIMGFVRNRLLEE